MSTTNAVETPDEATGKLNGLLKGLTLTDIVVCPGDDGHDAHMDLYFGDTVLQLVHTPRALVMGVHREVALTGEAHDQHAPCGSVQ